jgi:hypothetical protein
MTVQIYNHQVPGFAAGAVSHLVKGCAAQHSGQLLMLAIWLTS